MLIAGVVAMAVGAFALGGFVVLEIKSDEPKWKIWGKASAGLFALGGVLMALDSVL